MTIINMTYGKGNPFQPFHLNGISDLAAVDGNQQATITWTDPGNLVVDGQTLATWGSTKLVRKVGSAPTDSSDGTLVLTETVADTYSVTGYTDTGLTNGTTYYYGAFATSTEGLETISNTPSVTPTGWNPGANTVLYYSFNDDTATTVYDGVSNNDGTWVGGNGQYIALTQGKYADFTQATNQYITIPTSLAYPTTNLTISFWIKYTSTASMGIFHKWNGINGTNAYVIIHTNEGQIRADIPYKKGDIRYSGTQLNDGNWHHIACTKNGSSYIMYVDTQQTSSTSSSQSIDGGSATQGNIGRHQGNGNLLDGGLDEFIIENVAWSSQDVSDYYDLTKANYGIS